MDYKSPGPSLLVEVRSFCSSTVDDVRHLIQEQELLILKGGKNYLTMSLKTFLNCMTFTAQRVNRQMTVSTTPALNTAWIRVEFMRVEESGGVINAEKVKRTKTTARFTQKCLPCWTVTPRTTGIMQTCVLCTKFFKILFN